MARMELMDNPKL